MTTLPRPRLVSRSTDLEAEDLPEPVTIALREVAGAAKEGLLAFSVGIGLAVLDELFEAEVVRLAGAKGKHVADRRAYRHGHEPRQVTLGGRRVQVNKPRVRSVDEEEIELRTFRTFAKRDLLNEAALGRMLAGLSTRRYSAGLEPVGTVEARATSKSAISHRFIQGTEQKLAELFGRDLRPVTAATPDIEQIQSWRRRPPGRPAGAVSGGSRHTRAGGRHAWRRHRTGRHASRATDSRWPGELPPRRQA